MSPRPRKPSKTPTRSHASSGKRSAKAKTPEPTKGTHSRKRGVVDSDANTFDAVVIADALARREEFYDDVFIAKLPSSSVRSGVAIHADDDGDDDVFVATPGRPVEVQSDWTEDATYAEMLAAQPDGSVLTILPDAMSVAELGFVRDTRAVHGYSCKYGCPGIVSDPPTIAAHHYACDYWRFEGRTKTPF